MKKHTLKYLKIQLIQLHYSSFFTTFVVAMAKEQSNIKSRSGLKLEEPHKFAVVLHNDDFTTMEFVVEVLMKVFYKSMQEAEMLMLAVHHSGHARIGSYSYDIACTKAARATEMARAEGFPLRITVEEV